MRALAMQRPASRCRTDSFEIHVIRTKMFSNFSGKCQNLRWFFNAPAQRQHCKAPHSCAIEFNVEL